MHYDSRTYFRSTFLFYEDLDNAFQPLPRLPQGYDATQPSLVHTIPTRASSGVPHILRLAFRDEYKQGLKGLSMVETDSMFGT